MLLTAAPVQLPPQLPRDGLQVHEVAEASPCALPHLVLAAAGFSEVGHRGELGVDRLAIKPAVVQVNHGLFRIFFTAKLDIHVPNKVVSEVVADVHLLHLPVLLLHFCENLLKKFIIVFLHLDIAHSTAQTVSRLGRVLRVTVNVQEGNGLKYKTQQLYIMEN